MNFIFQMGFIITTTMKTIKWSVKLGIGFGGVYLGHQRGLFGSSEQAQHGLEQLKSDVNDFIVSCPIMSYRDHVPKEVLENVPDIKLPDIKAPDVKLPDFINIKDMSWNKFVWASFSAGAHAPQAIKNYSNDVVVYIQEQIDSK